MTGRSMEVDIRQAGQGMLSVVGQGRGAHNWPVEFSLERIEVSDSEHLEGICRPRSSTPKEQYSYRLQRSGDQLRGEVKLILEPEVQSVPTQAFRFVVTRSGDGER